MMMAAQPMMMAPQMVMTQPVMQPQMIQQPMVMNPYGTMQYAQTQGPPLSPTPSSVSTVIDNDNAQHRSQQRSQHVEENVTEINRHLVSDGGGHTIERVEVVDYDTGDILD